MCLIFQIEQIEFVDKNFKNEVWATNYKYYKQKLIIMKRKITTFLLLVFIGLSGSLHALSKDEVTLTVKLISAECFEGCTYDFEDVSTGEKITLSWNTKYDEQKHINTFPDLDSESAKIMNLIERCAASSYDDGISRSYCQEVKGKTFLVKADKKTREEEVETAPMTWKKTGKIEVYYEIKNIRAKYQKVYDSEIDLMKSQSKQKLNSTTFFETSEEEKSKSHTLYYFSLSEKKRVILAFTTNQQNGCHVCAPMMSVFVFENNSNWIMSEKNLKFGSIGSWGKAPLKEKISLYPAKNDFLITIKTGYASQGSYSGNLSCYFPINKIFKEIGNIELEYDNSDFLGDENKSTSFNSQISLIENENDLPKIYLQKTGKKEGKRFSESEFYIFNGKEYIIK